MECILVRGNLNKNFPKNQMPGGIAWYNDGIIAVWNFKPSILMKGYGVNSKPKTAYGEWPDDNLLNTSPTIWTWKLDPMTQVGEILLS